jgi:predicted xylose isomerase-like sugar epimerase
MTSHIENILLRGSNEKNLEDLSSTSIVSIRIGNLINCNDELIRDNSTYDKIKKLLNKHGITAKQINRIDTYNEYSVELILYKKDYLLLISKIKRSFI